MLFHSRLSEISFGDKGMTAKMLPQDVNHLSPDDLRSGQQALAQRVSNLEQETKAQAQSASAPQPRSPSAPLPQAQNQVDTTPQTLSGNTVYRQPAQSVAPSIAGYWTSADGATYAIAQKGNYVVFQGYSAGTLAIVGNGQVAGS